jgi:hypothetical protein
MNVESPTPIPSLDWGVIHGGLKRHRSDWGKFPLDVIQQEETGDGWIMEVGDASPKRRKQTHFFSASPSVISVSLTQDDSGVCDGSFHEPLSSSMLLQSPEAPAKESSSMQGKPVEWWKQKHRLSTCKTKVEGADSCVVCQRTFPSGGEISSNTCPGTGMRDNSLLAYFTPLNNDGDQKHPPKPKHSSLQAPLNQPSAQDNPGSELCSFCERSACNDCIARCEECGDLFCSFCSTIDYYGTIARTLCLDCNSERTNAQDGDDMHID